MDEGRNKQRCIGTCGKCRQKIYNSTVESEQIVKLTEIQVYDEPIYGTKLIIPVRTSCGCWFDFELRCHKQTDGKYRYGE